MSDRVTGLQRIRVARGTLTGIVASENLTRIDLLKLDVEGSEVKVLAGIDPRLEGHPAGRGGERRRGGDHAVASIAARCARVHGVRVAESPSMQQRGLRNVPIYASK